MTSHIKFYHDEITRHLFLFRLFRSMKADDPQPTQVIKKSFIGFYIFIYISVDW